MPQYQEPLASGSAASASSPASLSETTEWCLGLPLVANRPLMPEEVAGLQSEANRLRGTGCALGCASPLVFLFPLLFLAGVGDWLHRFPTLDAVITLCVLLLFLPAALLFLKSSDALKRSRGLRKDAIVAFVKRFSTTNDSSTPAAQAASVAPPATETNLSAASPSGAPNCIEVLPCSHRLWKVNDEPVLKWAEANWSEVAEPSPFAAMAANWVEPLAPRPPEAVGSLTPLAEQRGKRELTAAEQEEVRCRIRRTWQRPLWPTLLLSAWFWIPLVACLLTGTPLRPEPSAYMLLAFVMLSYYRLTVGVQIARRLNIDLRTGETVILRIPFGMLRAGNLAGPAAVAGNDDEPTIVVEVLPASGLIWTEAGRPASWRKVPEG